MDAPDADDLMTLAEACRVVFRDAIKSATLRAEVARGRLVVSRIGRKDFVTRRALAEMEVKCRIIPKMPVPVSGMRSTLGMAEAERAKVAQAAAVESARALRRRKSS